ncbi:hypothetical protein PT276_00690 [Orbaceae bacterium ESL0721]|nr:hypothetical protein [Orbaceae bacterium ESL0721]
MMLLTYILYYIISIFTVIVGIYFCRFTEEDYEYNPSLRKKCRYVIIWTFAVMLLLQAAMVMGAETLFIYPLIHPSIRFFAMVFAILYSFLLSKIMTPRPTRKKKKKFK